MTMLELEVGGKIVAYARDDERGREAADREALRLLDHADIVVVRRVTRAPRGARRIDR